MDKEAAQKYKTGQEVGRLMIQDLVACYRGALEGGGAGLLDDAEKIELVNALTTGQDVKRYNELRYVHDYLAQIPTAYSLYEQTAETLYWRLYFVLKELEEAETENNRLQLEPRVMTKAQYTALKHTNYEAAIHDKYTMDQALLQDLLYQIRCRNRNQSTPLDPLFRHTREMPISNLRVYKLYASLRGKTVEEATMFDIIWDASRYYGDNMDELAQDFPELYQALLGRLQALTAAPAKERYHCYELYTARIPWAVERYQSVISAIGRGGVAVLQPHDDLAPAQEPVVYVPPVPYWRGAYMAESVLARHRDAIASQLHEYVDSMRWCFVIAAAVRLIGEWIDVPDVSILIGEVNIEQLEQLNRMMTQLPEGIRRYGCMDGERPAEELKRELRALLRPITISSLKPREEAIAAARATIDFTTVQGNARRLYLALMGGGKK